MSFGQSEGSSDNLPTLQSAQTVVDTSGDCPVCGCVLGDNTRQCESCATLHHPDCWKYNGGCATFACPNRGDYPPASASRVPDDCCPVCAAALRGATVRCRSCRNAHHVDCWVQNSGCGTVGCTLNPTAATAVPLPDKILLPKVRVGLFLGKDFVPVPTAVFAIAMELLSILLAPTAPSLSGLCLVGLVLGLIWAAVTAERFNINIGWRSITKSKLVLGGELFEWRWLNFEDVRALGQVVDPDRGTAHLAVRQRADSAVYQLTPTMKLESEEHQELVKLLAQMHAFSVVPVPELDQRAPPRAIGHSRASGRGRSV